MACALNGFVRTTEDVDILVEREPDNLRRMLEVLRTVGEGYARELRVDDFSDEEGAVRLVEDFPIDIFTRLGGRTYGDLLEHRKLSEGDPPIPFLDASGLILVKSGSSRPQDRFDVEALRRLEQD